MAAWGTVAGQAFGPGDMSILVDDSVRFTITSDEVHMTVARPVR